nr:MAG TPA: hypothetical protein [Caudoviricetes sp.]
MYPSKVTVMILSSNPFFTNQPYLHHVPTAHP